MGYGNGCERDLYGLSGINQAPLQFHLASDENLSLPVNIDRMVFIQVISNFLGNTDKGYPEWFYCIRMQSG